MMEQEFLTTVLSVWLEVSKRWYRLKMLLRLIFTGTLFILACLEAKQAGPLKLAYVGDSLTEGLGIEKTATYPAVIEQILAEKGYQVTTINAGVSGATSASAVSRVRYVLKAKPDWIVLALGANDGLRGLNTEALKKNLSDAIDLAKTQNTKVLLVGMKMPANFGLKYPTQFEKVYTGLARDKKIPFVPFLLEKVGGERSLNLSDGLHPNEKGHRIMAETVLKVLESNL